MNARLFLFVGLVMAVFGMAALLLAKAAWARLRGRSAAPYLTGPGNTLVLGLAAAGALCIFYARYVEPRMLEVVEIVHESAKVRRPLAIAHLSDLHLRREIDLDDKIVRAVDAAKPDLLVLAGDYLSDAGSLARLHALLRRLAAGRPTYAVKGNWDSWYWQGLDLFGGTGVVELDGNVAEQDVPGGRVRLAGVAVRNENATPRLLESFAPDALNVYVYHSPDLAEEVSGRGVDLYLGGHTHGGQVRLPFYGALITFSKFDKKYEMGLYRRDGLALYVNRGIGTEGHVPPIRFMSVPEVTIHRIVPAVKTE